MEEKKELTSKSIRFLNEVDGLKDESGKRITAYAIEKMDDKKIITQGKITHIRSGRNEPSDEVIDRLCELFPSISKAQILVGDEYTASAEFVKSELIPKEYKAHIPVRVVTTKARAGYSDAYYADEYLNDMPTILIEADKEHKGRYLAFEVDGDSMEPEYNRGDVVICREVPRSNWQYKLHYEQWDFVIAHGTQGIMLKEITSHNVETGEIVCHSLNAEMHPDFTLNLREVAFLYNIVEHRRSGRKYRRRN